MARISARVLLAGASALAVAGPLAAQDTPATLPVEEPQDDPVALSSPEDEVGEIVVTGQRLRGEVETDVPVEQELGEADIAAYGAASIGELLQALSPQTGSARGRGGGQPVVLINGQRVSGFRELIDLPPEAIERVQIFPEELALQYGFRPDQRVVNFILKPNYRSIAVEAGYGLATDGGFETNEIEATLTRIGRTGRLNLNAEFEPSSGLLQSERDIIQSRTDALGLVDEGRFRTLLPRTDPLELAASYARPLGTRTNLALTASYDRTRTLSLLGLPVASFTAPQTGARITRLFPAGGALERDGKTDGFEVAANANGQIGDWRWTAGTTYTRGLNRSFTDRQPDAAALIAGVASGAIDPLDPGLALAGERTTDTTRSLSGRTQATATVTGSPFQLPAGDAQLTLTADGRLVTLDTRARGRVVSDVSLTRRGGLVRGNVVLPITSVREGFGDAIGTLSVNGNGGLQELSDFGRLTEYGYGLTWEPFEWLSLIASVIGEQAAPTLTQLGAPQLLTPNAPVFDGARGTVFADLLTGGNPDLRRESRRDTKLSLTVTPGGGGGGGGRRGGRGGGRGGGGETRSFVVEYLTNRSTDVTAGFPLLTPAIEAAFPDRVTRDAGGGLTQLDLRPVTFDRLTSSRLRFGVTLGGSLGPEPERGGPRGGEAGGAGGRLGERAAGARVAGERAAGEQGAGERPSGERPGGAGERRRPPSGDASGTTSGDVAGTAPPTRTPEGAGEAAPATTPAPAARPAARPSPLAAAFGGRGGGGRWFLSVYDVWQLDNRVLIRPGMPELNLLGGDVTDGSTPIARHQVQLEGGVFKDGLGLRLSGSYTSRAVLSDGGTGLNGGTASELGFGEIATLSARVFIDFDQREDALAALPVLKGGRLSLRLDNIFGGVRAVRDQFGVTPLSFQPSFLDPRGRFVEVSFRKRF